MFPRPGRCLLVANHQSHLDPVLVGLACPRQLKYLARHDLFFWPFSWWIRALGAVPIDRKRGVVGGMKTTLKLLQQNEAVLVFPEGSRTYDGQSSAAAARLLPACAAQRRDHRAGRDTRCLRLDAAGQHLSAAAPDHARVRSTDYERGLRAAWRCTVGTTRRGAHRAILGLETVAAMHKTCN